MVVAVLLAGAAQLSPDLAARELGPDAATVRRAAESYDAGVRAWNTGRYAEAASHFEAADEVVPSPVALGEAIKSRERANHRARAATLAALALRRHGKNAAVRDLAEGVLTRLAPSLHRLEVRCATPCVLAAGTRAIVGPPARQAVIYVEPGQVTVSASFADGSGSAQQGVVAKAGGNNSLYLRPRAPASPAAEPSAVGRSRAGAVPRGGGRAPAPSEPQPASGRAHVPPGASPAEGDEPWRGLSPVFFFVGVGATAVLGGVTIWSGVDTVADPGQDTVRNNCVGLGPECPEYREGLDKEMRTNALIGVTVGTAALTAVLGLFLTDWGGEPSEDSDGAVAVRLQPIAGSGLPGLCLTF